MKKLFADFKAFISKGNVLDLAVGMIIGAAFTAIVNSIVSGILNPLIAMIPGADGTSALQVVLKEAQYDAGGELLQDAVILDFGAVITAVVTFLLTALLLFFIVKAIAGAQKKAAAAREAAKKAREDKLRAEGKLPPLEEAAEEEVPPTTEELLMQIRDLLLIQNKANGLVPAAPAEEPAADAPAEQE